jgi:hypothetical protein
MQDEVFMLLAKAIQPHLEFPNPPLPDSPLSYDGSPAFLINGEVKCITDLPTMFSLLLQHENKLNEAGSKISDMEEEIEELNNADCEDLVSKMVDNAVEAIDFEDMVSTEIRNTDFSDQIGTAIEEFLSDGRNLEGMKDALDITDLSNDVEELKGKLDDLECAVEKLPDDDQVDVAILESLRDMSVLRKSSLAEYIDERIDGVGSDESFTVLIKNHLEEYRTDMMTDRQLILDEKIPEIVSVVLEQRLQTSILHRGFLGRLKWLFTGR